MSECRVCLDPAATCVGLIHSMTGPSGGGGDGLQSEYRIFIDQRERRPIKAVMGKGLIRQDVRMLPTGDRFVPSALIRGHMPHLLLLP